MMESLNTNKQFTVDDNSVSKENHVVLLLSNDHELRSELSGELGGAYCLIQCDSLESLKQQLASTAHRAVLVHMRPETIGSTSPKRFMADMTQAVELAPIYALVDPDCPTKLLRLVTKAVDMCLDLPLDYGRLRQALDNGHGMSHELERLLKTLPHKTLVGGQHLLVTFSPELFQTLDELELASRYDVTVLLTGETGSGKTHLAQVLHELSPRCDERFVTVACGAIPPDLIESELFGYVKGAFTGADRDKEGKFAAAGDGTLLLDEIDVLPLDQQAKLLRVIETSEYEPVGSNETQYSQARLIVASNDELPGLVDSGLFRPDLYYRLNVVNFHLPPLRDRPWDIEYLARRFALDYSRGHNINLRETDPSFIQAIRSYAWPGNIRELKNVVHRSVLYCRRGKLTVSDLPSTIGDVAETFSATPQGPLRTLGEQMDMLERRIIEDSLRRNKYSRKETSSELGIGRVTLYNKMKRFDLLD
ncbi:MAG: sigma-54 dependent transcriptional regulator [Pirellulaceae bacterium]|nr:sigma-54 dependent transcriptional regulator [Pirellulaceae bacterium]